MYPDFWKPDIRLSKRYPASETVSGKALLNILHNQLLASSDRKLRKEEQTKPENREE